MPNHTAGFLERIDTMKCLIVDDDPSMRTLVKHYLKDIGLCDLAYDGHEAIAIFRVALENGESYDLVCSDITMPLSNGHDTVTAIRELEAKHGIFGSDATKIIMLTALDDPKNCVRAFREGCEVYLCKPVEREALLAAVQSLTGVTDSSVSPG
jgi:two-component system, chemotaxis family, chemotaxis protein CheY